MSGAENDDKYGVVEKNNAVDAAEGGENGEQVTVDESQVDSNISGLSGVIGKTASELLTRSGRVDLLREVEVFKLEDHKLLHQLANRLSYHSNALLNLSALIEKVDGVLARLFIEENEADEEKKVSIADIDVTAHPDVQRELLDIGSGLEGIYKVLGNLNATYSLIVNGFGFLLSLSRASFQDKKNRTDFESLKSELKRFGDYEGKISLKCLRRLRSLYDKFDDILGWPDLNKEKLQGLVDDFVVILNLFADDVADNEKFLKESAASLEIGFDGVGRIQGGDDEEVLRALKSLFEDDFERLRRNLSSYGQYLKGVRAVVEEFSYFKESRSLDGNLEGVDSNWFNVFGALKDLSEMTVDEGIELRFDGQDTRVKNIFIDLNEGDFSRMIEMLVVNGVSAIKRGNFDEGRVKVFPYVADGELCVEVRDNGVGIGSENLEKLNNAEDGFSTTGGGDGLRDVRGVLGKIGGEIEFYSEGSRAKGAIVTVRIPLEGNDLVTMRD